jgi:hypothetical protein
MIRNELLYNSDKQPREAGELSMELLAHVTMNEVLVVVGVYFVGVVSGLAIARGVWNR